jgi:hypothetical protein
MTTCTEVNTPVLVTATPLSAIEHLCVAIVMTSINEPEQILPLAHAVKLLAEAAVLIAPISDASVSISE